MYTHKHARAKRYTFDRAIDVAGASGAAPGPDWEAGEYRAEAKHVVASLAFVAQEELLGPIALPAMLADQMVIVVVAGVGLCHTLRHPHDLLHRPELPGGSHLGEELVIDCRAEN